MKKFGYPVMILILLIGSTTLFAQKTTEIVEFNKVTVDTSVSDRCQVVIHLTQPTKYTVFTMDKPPLVAVDLMNTVNKWETKQLSVNHLLSKGVRASQYMTEPNKVTRVVIDLTQKVDYQSEKKDNQIIITLNKLEDSKEVKETKETKEIKESKETPVQSVTDTKKSVSATTNVKKKTKESESITSTKTTDTPKVEEEASTIPSFGKQPISLVLNDVDIREVLRMIQLKSGINIIYGSDVSGSVTINLKEVPLDEAINIILNLRGYVIQPVGKNVVRVLTPENLTVERSRAVTYTRIFSLNYGQPEDIKARIDEIRSAEGRKGVAGVDKWTNSIVITDTQEGLAAAERLIKELDRKPFQVMIEAKIVEVVLGSSMDLGVDWGLSQKSGDINIAAGLKYPGAGSGAAAGTATGGEISFGIISNTLYLTTKLSALARENKSRILSSPKITTLNNQEAYIRVGQNVPYKKTEVTAGGSVQSTVFTEVGIRFRVKPTVNIDRRISMKIKPEVSLVIEYRTEGPVIATREADTSVMVKDGETIVIGGLISDQDIQSVSKVPLLSELPVLGDFFKRNFNTKDKTELLVFLTPRIIEE